MPSISIRAWDSAAIIQAISTGRASETSSETSGPAGSSRRLALLSASPSLPLPTP
jgi:hypothetical protein